MILELDHLLPIMNKKTNRFFGYSLNTPQLHFAKTEKEYFELYYKFPYSKKHTIDNLNDFKNTDSFYCTTENTIVFPHYRSRRRVFLTIQNSSYDSYRKLLLMHELVHAYQNQCGGLDLKDDFFTEATAEFVSYVLTGYIPIDNTLDYYLKACALYEILKGCGLSKKEMIEWNKMYILSSSKKRLAENIVDQYLQAGIVINKKIKGKKLLNVLPFLVKNNNYRNEFLKLYRQYGIF